MVGRQARRTVPALLQAHRLEPQRIADHADAGEGHGASRQDRVQFLEERWRPGKQRQNTGRYRDQNAVVTKSPAQILANIAHRRPRQLERLGHLAQVATHQGDVSRLHSHIGTGANGDADVGLGQRRGVVDAIAHHGHHLASRL